MKKMIHKIPMWILMVWPYVFFLGSFFAGNDASFVGIYTVLSIILCVGNIVNACKYKKDGNIRELAFMSMMIKLVHIPFYMVVFLLAIVMVMSMVMASSTLAAPFILLFLVLCDFLFMITSSMYCVKSALIAESQGIMKSTTARMLGICSFILIADVICSIVIYNNIKKSKKKVGEYLV